jgi:hypothetical protein
VLPEPGAAGALSPKVDGEIVHGAPEPRAAISADLELYDRQDKRVLNHVPGVFFR